MKIDADILKSYKDPFGNKKQYNEGYRLVYFYDDNKYEIGAYSNNIENFMYEFSKTEEAPFDSSIPAFISTTDLLQKLLEEKNDVKSIAIYNIDGTLVHEEPNFSHET